MSNGIRLLIQDVAATILDLNIPGGALSQPYGENRFLGNGIFWQVNKSGNKSTWRNFPQSAPGGVSKVIVKDKSKKKPGLVSISVQGKAGAYGVSADTLPLTAVLVLDPATGQCATAKFPGPKKPRCAFNASGSSLKCK